MADLLVRAFAKINLALAVGPPEPAGSLKPGFHRIASWMAPIMLHDELELTRRGGVKATGPHGTSPQGHIGAGGAGLGEAVGSCRLVIEWAEDAPRPSVIDWPEEKDLAFRAHGLLEAHVGRALPVDALLRKRTPVGGGLGGGSSDAAAMLRGLNRLFGLGVSVAELQRLSAGLGSDVAFFIDEDREGELAADAAVDGDGEWDSEDACDSSDRSEALVSPGDADGAETSAEFFRDAPRSAIVTGFGDVIERVETPCEDVLLIVPAFGCPTGPVYRAFDAGGPGVLREMAVRKLVADAMHTGEISVAELFNDLAEPACVVEPRLREVMSRVFAPTAIPVYVSGSGSTLFVPFDVPEDEEAINRLADLAEQNLPLGTGDGLGVVCVPTGIV